MDPKNKKVIIIVVVLVFVGLGILIAAITGGLFVAGNKINADQANANANTNIPVANTNTETNENSNSSVQNINIGTTTQETTVQGRVFTQGYNTPSESFGILTTDDREIGLGSYDTMREQIREYVGEDIEVTFSSICKSSTDGCCRTLFTLCGTVKSWKGLD